MIFFSIGSQWQRQIVMRAQNRFLHLKSIPLYYYYRLLSLYKSIIRFVMLAAQSNTENIVLLLLLLLRYQERRFMHMSAVQISVGVRVVDSMYCWLRPPRMST